MAGLAEFMDRHVPPGRNDPTRLGFRPAQRSLASSGPNSARIARAAPSRDAGEQLLATMFWWCYVQSVEFERDTSSYRDDLDGLYQGMMVGHRNGSRFDLLILTRSVREPFAIQVGYPANRTFYDGSGSSLTRVALREAERIGVMLDRAGINVDRAGINVDQRAAVLTVNELARNGDFSLVLAPRPEETPTAGGLSARVAAPSFMAPSPALEVTIDGELRPVASAGVVGRHADGRMLVTTAWHVVSEALARSLKLRVGGQPAEALTPSDVLTDSCVLAVACPTMPGMGSSGVLHRPPMLYRPAVFAGAASGSKPKRTRITSFDLSMVSPTPHSGSRVYTDPDTIPGDSGAALIDEDDHIVGFAVGRTAFGAPVEFSTWSWAEQVFTVHGLGDCRGTGDS